MLKRGIGYLIIIVVVLGISAGLIIGKEKVIGLNPKSWVGEHLSELSNEVHKYISQNEIVLSSTPEGIITDIFIRTAQVSVDSIKVGDEAHKILQVYPKEWITSFPNYILVLKGKESSFGVATEYIIYLVQDKKVKEIQLGYTTNFLNKKLPSSNEKAEQLLQGTWISEQDKIITFKDGVLEDSLLKDLYEYQTYRVMAPNKLLISRIKDGKIEKINLRFFVEENTLYLFDINKLGIPIIETIEKFEIR